MSTQSTCFKNILHVLFSGYIFQVLNPFYIFQIASIVLWSADNYYYYAACILLISCISMGISLYETKKVSEDLKLYQKS